MPTMSAGSGRSFDLRRQPVTRGRLCMILLVPERTDGSDGHGTGEVIRSDVTKNLDAGIVDGVVDALEQRREGCLGLSAGRVSV